MAKEKLNKSNKEKDNINPKTKKMILTLFLFLLPLLILAFTKEFVTKVLLFFYLAVLLKNFISDKTKPELD